MCLSVLLHTLTAERGSLQVLIARDCSSVFFWVKKIDLLPSTGYLKFVQGEEFRVGWRSCFAHIKKTPTKGAQSGLAILTPPWILRQEVAGSSLSLKAQKSLVTSALLRPSPCGHAHLAKPTTTNRTGWPAISRSSMVLTFKEDVRRYTLHF